MERAISLGKECMQAKYHERRGTAFEPEIVYAKYSPFKAAALSVLKNIANPALEYYDVVEGLLSSRFVRKAEGAIAVLEELKHAIENGYLSEFRRVVAASVFSDYLEMAEHLIVEGYKDPAAVIVGSTLEEHMRELCRVHDIDTADDKGRPKKTELLNDDLYKKDVYNLLDKKNVTAWLDLRNKAAHGHYGEYNQSQVEQLLVNVREFIARVH